MDLARCRQIRLGQIRSDWIGLDQIRLDRQTDKDGYRQIDREIDRQIQQYQTDLDIYRYRQVEIDRQIDSWIDRQIDRQI